MSRAFLRGAFIAGVVSVIGSGAWAATTTQFLLRDHPDSARTPPPYGLRFDGLFSGDAGASGGVTTFSMGRFASDPAKRTILSVIDNGGSLTINIKGTLWGGEDSGNNNTANPFDPANYGFGLGEYALDFTYRMNVNAMGTGWVVSNDSAMNNGTLTALTGPKMGTVYNLFDQFGNPPGFSFAFKQDEHRLSGHPQFGQGYWVGRGWQSATAGSNTSGTQDFLFIGKLIPLPTPVSMGAIGLVGLAFVRRRRP